MKEKYTENEQMSIVCACVFSFAVTETSYIWYAYIQNK